MAHYETNPASDKSGRIPQMGENTNEDIGGVLDWQNVGEDTAADDLNPPLGPLAKMANEAMKNPTIVRGSERGAKLPPIDAKSTGGMVDKPVYGTSERSYSRDASLNYDGGITGTASNKNLSAKFKNPQVKQGVPAAGRNQYE